MTKEERKLYIKEYNKKNKNKKKEYNKKFREENKDYNKKYREENKERLIEYDKVRNKTDKRKEKCKLYHLNNIDSVKEQKADYRLKNKEKINQAKAGYRLKNKDKIKEADANLRQTEHRKQYMKEYNKTYSTNRMLTDKLFKVRKLVSSLIKNALRSKNYTKKSRTFEILGCTYEEFKTHIESQWESWMTWENYGLYNGTDNYGWDIDHIIPTSSAINEEGVIALNHYTNLQPLCSKYNRYIKKDNLI